MYVSQVLCIINLSQVIAELDKAEKQRIKLQESKNELETKIYAVRNAIDEAELKVRSNIWRQR